MPRNKSEKAPTLKGVHPQVLRFLQCQATANLGNMTSEHRPEYEALGHVRRIAYRHAYSEFIDAQKSK